MKLKSKLIKKLKKEILHALKQELLKKKVIILG